MRADHRTRPALGLRLSRAADRLARYPVACVTLTVLSFAFLGPLAAVVLVATMLVHESAHRAVMARLGYAPGPVRLLPLIGAYIFIQRRVIGGLTEGALRG